MSARARCRGRRYSDEAAADPGWGVAPWAYPVGAMWRRFIPRSSAGLTLAACMVGGVLASVAYSVDPPGLGDVLAGLAIGGAVGLIGYAPLRAFDWWRGRLWRALMWPGPQKRPPPGEDSGRPGGSGRPEGEGWR